MLAPAMLAIGIAMMVVGPRTIDRSQLRNSSESPAQVRAYRAALSANVRRVRSVAATGSLVEVDLPGGSPLAGLTVATAGWPSGTVLVTIVRADRVIVPRSDAVLHAGDRKTVFSTDAGRAPLEALLGAAPRAMPVAAEALRPYRLITRPLRAQAPVPPRTETAPSNPSSSRRPVAPVLRLPDAQITA